MLHWSTQNTGRNHHPWNRGGLWKKCVEKPQHNKHVWQRTAQLVHETIARYGWYRDKRRARGERYVTIATRSESLLGLSPPSERSYPPRYQIHSPGPTPWTDTRRGKETYLLYYDQLNPKFRLDNSLISQAGRKPKSLRQQCRFPLQISATIGRYNASLCVAQSNWRSLLSIKLQASLLVYY